jgi:threonine dehydrogenase-like Zn-dependent dehydrogenase
VFCGQCGPCHEGRTNLCEQLKTTGFDRDGAYARYVTVPAFNLFPLPENVTYDQAAAIQALGISYHAVAHRARARPRERIAVIGAGPVGLGAGLIAQLLGAEVTITDVLEYRLAKARELGIASTLDANSADLHARALELTEGRGFDKVIECVGGAQERTVADAAALVKRGGQITIVGTFPENRASIPIAHLKDREIDINFSRGNFQAFGPCLELVARRMLDPNRYISHRFPLSEAKEALQLLEARNAAVHKVVLRPCDDG